MGGSFYFMAKSKKLQGKINKIRNLAQYKDLSESELEKIAQEKLLEEKNKNIPDEVNQVPLFPKEKKIFKKIYDKYIKSYNITEEVDKDLLIDLVYNKILKLRYLDYIQQLSQDGTDIPSDAIENYQKVVHNIVKIEEKMGLFNDRGGLTPYNYVERLKKRFRAWLEKNQGSRELNCPWCSKEILLKIRTDKYDAVKHPFFKDRILTNKKLIELYLDDRITREEIGEILEVSKFYMDWVLEKHLSKNNPLYSKYLKKLEREKLEKAEEKLPSGVTEEDLDNPA